MNRYQKFIAIICVLLSLTTTSCKKDFLQIFPKGKNVAITFEDYDALMNESNFYVLGNGSWSVSEPAAIMGDEVSAEAYAYNLTGNGFIAARGFFQWQDDIFPLNDIAGDGNSSMPKFLNILMADIYTLNKIINDVNKATTGSDQQKLALKSEAMAVRAFINLQLLNYFTKPYQAATAPTDPGFPAITTANTQVATFSRGTLQQSYDFMISDLTQAIPNLPIQSVFQTRICKAAAEGILGKIYLSMGNYSGALAYLNNAFINMAKMSTKPTLYNYNTTFATGGSFLPINPTTGPNSPFMNNTDIKESLWAVFTFAGPHAGNSYSTNFLTLPAQTTALFDPTDWRLKFYTNLQIDNRTPIPGGRVHRNNLKWARIGIELSDLYLLKAEAEARAGSLTNALSDVSTLRANRMPAAVAAVPLAIGNDRTALIKFIINERIREFAGLGARWFDMRRLSNDPIFSGQPAAQHTVYTDATNGTTYTLTPNRLALRLPPLYLNQNPGMVDNP